MKQLYLHNVATLKLDESKCIGCGRCAQVCPHGVFQIRDKKAVILELDRCMECGACARNCPADALWVKAGTGCAIAILRGMIARFLGKEEPAGEC